ncbi:MAG TPA: hypothetical protein VKA73_14805 [Rubrobacter sp.]|nr:hypothetical protein [Rubrobacter sp.]
MLVCSFIGKHDPAGSRAAALGWSAGIGRLGAIVGPIMEGGIVGAGQAVPWGYCR